MFNPKTTRMEDVELKYRASPKMKRSSRKYIIAAKNCDFHCSCSEENCDGKLSESDDQRRPRVCWRLGTLGHQYLVWSHTFWVRIPSMKAVALFQTQRWNLPEKAVTRRKGKTRQWTQGLPVSQLASLQKGRVYGIWKRSRVEAGKMQSKTFEIYNPSNTEEWRPTDYTDAVFLKPKTRA